MEGVSGMDALIGRELVKVERLGWCEAGVGPVHLVFQGEQAMFLAGRSDWSLEVVQARLLRTWEG